MRSIYKFLVPPIFTYILPIVFSSCRSVSSQTSSEKANVAQATADCASGVFRVLCADGHTEFQSLQDLEMGRVCPQLTIKVLYNTKLDEIEPESSLASRKSRLSCDVFRGMELQAFTIGIVQSNQRRRIKLSDRPGTCLLLEAEIDDNAIAAKVDRFSLAAGDSFPADICRIPGRNQLRRLGLDQPPGKGPLWGQCGGRYKESHCAELNDIPPCERLD
ncbi:MAG: hypothetical protein NTX25_13055 [Proteobacteria bacterium]|nr:hypothetical protein [Pseudomonadota bacterium]